MALSRFFRDKNVSNNRASVSVRSMPKKDTGPKNGPMIIGVVSTIVVMIALTFINIRLLSAPTPSNEPVSQSHNSKKLNPVFPEMSSGKVDPKTCQPPTEVTFYNQLRTKEDKPVSGASVTQSESRHDASRPPVKTAQESAPANSKEEKSFSLPASSGHRSSDPIDANHDQDLTVEKSTQESSKGFVVQVGAFSHPRIAQEWASKWKAKGYKVTLKPVARPSSGIIYRLYLGDFESEKKADEFVKQLKAKEGITAMRLNARE